MNMLSKCMAVLTFVTASYSLATDVKLSDYARNAKGRILKMEWETAVEYCALKSSRLPTARELAQHAKSLGAKGIIPAPERNVDYLIEVGHDAESANGTDSFYYSWEGYQKPAGAEGKGLIWSSSVHPYNVDAYTLDNSDGRLYYYPNHMGNKMSVRCVVD